MTSAETLEILIRARGGAEAAGQLKAVATATDTTAVATGRAAVASAEGAAATTKATVAQREAATTGAGLSRSWQGLTSRAVSLAGRVVALGAAFFGFSAIKSSISTTEDLALSTMRLHRNLGLTVSDASAWAAVAKARNIDTNTLTTSFTKFSGLVDKANQGGKSQIETLSRLGISQRDLKQGDFNSLLFQAADAFGKMHGGTARQALAQQALGRGYKTLLPLMSAGAQGLRDELDAAKKYGATLDGQTIKSVGDLVKAHHEMQYAMIGFQLVIGTTIIPLLTKAAVAFNKLVVGWREGTGAGGHLKAVLVPMAQSLAETAKWFAAGFVQLTKWVGAVPGLTQVLGGVAAAAALIKGIKWAAEASGLTTLVGAVRTAATAIRAFSIAEAEATIYSRLFAAGLVATRVAEMAAAAAQWVMNAAMDAFPVLAIIAAIALIVTHWKQFKQIVVDVFNWIKGHWYLLAPIFGFIIFPIRLLIAVLIKLAPVAVAVFKALKTAGVAAFHGVEAAVKWVGGALSWLWHNILGPVASFVGGVFAAAWRVVQIPLRAVAAAFGAVKDVVVWLWDKLKGLLGFIKDTFLGGIHAIVSAVFPVIGIMHTLGIVGDSTFNQISNYVHGTQGAVDSLKASMQGLVGGVQAVSNAINAIPAAKLAALPSGAPTGSFSGWGGLQHGGTIASPRATVVGEVGPELLRLPGGARVEPISGAQGLRSALAGGAVREVVRIVTVDGKVMAEAVFGAAHDAAARA